MSDAPAGNDIPVETPDVPVEAPAAAPEPAPEPAPAEPAPAEPAPAETPVETPVNDWRTDLAGGDEKRREAIDNYGSSEAVVDALIAAKQKIYDWNDTDTLIAAQPLYVPRQFLDISQVQGVGYNLVAIDEIQAIFHLWRYLFYDGLEGRWVPPEDRYLKIWLIA